MISGTVDMPIADTPRQQAIVYCIPDERPGQGSCFTLGNDRTDVVCVIDKMHTEKQVERIRSGFHIAHTWGIGIS